MKRKLPIFTFLLNGIGIGIPVTLLCMTLIGGYNQVLKEFMTWTVASALFGLISGLVFQNNDKLNLPLSLAIHCVGCLAVAIGACLFCGYASSLKELVVSILPVFVIVYVLIYAVCAIAMKINEAKINKELNKE